MSLNYDYTKCEAPKDDTEHAIVDALIWGGMAIGMGEITESNAAEWYARIKFMEMTNSYLLNSGGKGYPFTPEMVKRWVGLKLNVSQITRAQFLKRWESDLSRFAKEYSEKFPVEPKEKKTRKVKA